MHEIARIHKNSAIKGLMVRHKFLARAYLTLLMQIDLDVNLQILRLLGPHIDPLLKSSAL